MKADIMHADENFEPKLGFLTER